jgi:superfamily II DNA/RNA helicase
MADDYVHRAGRTARAEMTGYSYTFVSNAEITDFKNIERSIKIPIKQVKLEDFDYSASPSEALEIPISQRLAEMRKFRSACRARAEAKKKPQTGADNKASGKTAAPAAKSKDSSDSDVTAKSRSGRNKGRRPQNRRGRQPGRR